MGRKELLEEACKLSIEERELLVRDIRRNIEEREAAELELTVAQYRELLERQAELDRNPELGSSWEVVKARLKVKP